MQASVLSLSLRRYPEIINSALLEAKIVIRMGGIEIKTQGNETVHKSKIFARIWFE